MTRTRLKNQKILFLLDFLRTIHAGTEKQLAYLLRELPRRGYSVSVITLQDSPFLKKDAASLFPEVCFQSLGIKTDIFKNPLAIIKLFIKIKNESPDIVQTFFPASNSIGILLARLAGVKKLISSRRDMGFNLTALDILKLRVANFFISGVIANSRAVKNQTVILEKINPEKISVIYNGLDTRTFQGTRCQKSGDRGCNVVIVANLNREVKRVDLFVKACAIVYRKCPEARFQIIGDGHLRGGLEQLATDLGVSCAMEFLGRRRDVPELLGHASMGIISSDSEGLSNSIMEYMAMALPVVATDVGGNSELVKNNVSGLIIPPGDEIEMAEAIIDLLRSPEKSKQMGLAGEVFISGQFSIQKMIEQTDHFYRKWI
jgi:glycosyltransferase involved in cell wall biosynthesis